MSGVELCHHSGPVINFRSGLQYFCARTGASGGQGNGACWLSSISWLLFETGATANLILGVLQHRQISMLSCSLQFVFSWQECCVRGTLCRPAFCIWCTTSKASRVNLLSSFQICECSTGLAYLPEGLPELPKSTGPWYYDGRIADSSHPQLNIQNLDYRLW